jgi:hypothetical protein
MWGSHSLLGGACDVAYDISVLFHGLIALTSWRLINTGGFWGTDGQFIVFLLLHAPFTCCVTLTLSSCLANTDQTWSKI